MNADELEVFEGFEKDDLQGRIWRAATPEDLREGLEKAFGYRGDVTLELKDGRRLEGYLFDRREGGSLETSVARLIPKDRREKVEVRYSEIAGVAFSGRDTAAGKSWEAWVGKYNEKKAKGETGIALEPESLDD